MLSIGVTFHMFSTSFPSTHNMFSFIYFFIYFCMSLGKDSGLHMREDMRGQLKEASSVTSKAFCAFRKELDPDLEGLGHNSELIGLDDALEETQVMSPAITIMKPILRYLQLLCENHNLDLQVLAPAFFVTESKKLILKSNCC